MAFIATNVALSGKVAKFLKILLLGEEGSLSLITYYSHTTQCQQKKDKPVSDKKIS